MPLTPDGWLDWAARVPGPPAKTYPAANAGVGVCLHSMEGSYDGSLRVLTGPRAASWQFSNRLSGEFVQHYPVTASCWASGNWAANTSLWSVESEGRAGEPLNAAQLANMLRLSEEFEAYRADKYSPKRALREPLGARTLWEHNEVALWTTPNAGPTACPSGRYQPFYDALEGGLSMDDHALLQALFKVLTGGDMAILEEWNGRGNSLLLGYAIEQERLSGHIADHARNIAGPIPEHEHESGKVARP